MNPEYIKMKEIEIDLHYIIVLDAKVSFNDLIDNLLSSNSLKCELKRISDIEIKINLHGNAEVEYFGALDEEEAQSQVIEETNETLNILGVNYSRI